MILQPSDLGWIAGMIDLKGLLMRKKNDQRRTTQTVLVVESRHIPIIARLSKYTGTEPNVQDNQKLKQEWQRRGCAEHCPSQHVHVRDVRMPSVSRWQITGSSFVVVMYNVLPHITHSPKAEKLRLAMEDVASTIPLQGQGRAAIDRAIRRLADLGWAIPSYLLPVHENE